MGFCVLTSNPDLDTALYSSDIEIRLEHIIMSLRPFAQEVNESAFSQGSIMWRCGKAYVHLIRAFSTTSMGKHKGL